MPRKEHDLEYIFHPRSVAVIGVSASSGGVANNFLLKSLIDAGYQGNLYPIHPSAREVMGLRAYPSITDVPGPVDQAIVSIPASSTPQIVEECVTKGVRAVSFYTAGFSESGSDTGKKLEAEILEIASSGDVRLIGPNCMGIYHPSIGLSFNPSFPRKSGRIGMLCQSGGNAMDLIETGPARGIYFSKVVSYGNAVDLNEADFLGYFAHDSETDVIAAYIEGIKNGPRFISALKDAAGVKPVLIVKGGRSKAGTRAVSSHTGSLAGTEAIWDTVYRQAGVISAVDLEELADLLVTFLFMQPPEGRNVGIVGVGGGASVLATDACENAGLIVPQLPDSVGEELAKFSRQVGTNASNPMDIPIATILTREGIYETLKVVAPSPELDFLLVHIEAHIGAFRQGLELLGEQAEGIIQASKECGKPVAIVIPPAPFPNRAEIAFTLTQKYLESGFPVYPSVSRAANAIAKFIRYHNNRKPVERQ